MLDYGQTERRFQARPRRLERQDQVGQGPPVEHIPTADETPAALIDISKKWGYIS